MDQRHKSKDGNKNVKSKKNVVILNDNIQVKDIEVDLSMPEKKTEKKRDTPWIEKAKTLPKVEKEFSKIEKNDKSLSDVKLPSKWVLWCHKISSNDWSLSGYEKLFEIKTVYDFWKVFNNFDSLGLEHMHFYLMRDDISPIWEDVENRNGGMCTIKCEFSVCGSVLEDLCVHMVMNSLLDKDKLYESQKSIIDKKINDNEKLTEEEQKFNKNNLLVELNGISISPKINSKNSFSIIKIWNRHYKNDISKLLANKIDNKYSKYSIQYKSNNPEY